MRTGPRTIQQFYGTLGYGTPVTISAATSGGVYTGCRPAAR